MARADLAVGAFARQSSRATRTLIGDPMRHTLEAPALSFVLQDAALPPQHPFQAINPTRQGGRPRPGHALETCGPCPATAASRCPARGASAGAWLPEVSNVALECPEPTGP